MKTKKYKKIILWLTIGTIGLSSACFAQTVENPFSEGVTLTQLTTTQIESLQEYLDASKTALTKALDQAKGKSFAEANSIYLSTIKNVVIESYKNTPRSGLLLRFALNESLGLTFGVPSSDGKSVAQSGVLSTTTNQDLLTVILEDSMNLALKYYQDDQQAVKSGSLLDLPYMSYAVDQLTLMRTWLESIPEYKLAYSASLAALKYYLIAASKDDAIHQKYYADEILEANQVLNDNPETAPSDPKVLMGKVRLLRGKIRKLLETTSKKVAAANAARPVVIPGSNGTTTSTTIGSTTPNSIGMEFVGLSGGTFTMGSSANESNRGSDETAHTVTVSSFQMQVTDVTQQQYFKVMGNNPSSFKTSSSCPTTFTSENGGMCPNNPVEQVTWNDTQTYVTKLNSQNDGYTYRLPTEAEWEYAARAGSTTAYSFGDSASILGDYAWYYDNSGSHTHEVKSKKANSFGLYDMHGNVWQWVQDWYGNYTNETTNPNGASSGSSRVRRGGGWSYGAQSLRSALRDYNSPGYSYYSVGFRLVRTPR